MSRPPIEGLKYFPFDIGFFGDRKIKLLRGEHGSEGVEIYIRLLCMCYEDNGYYLTWNNRDDCALLADDTGFSEDKVRLIVSNLLKRSLFDDTLFKSVNVLSSRGIQRRYFGAIRATKRKAAAEGRYTTIRKDVCLLTEEDFSELNEPTAWLKVAHDDGKSENNDGFSENNESKSPNNPAKETKEKKTILEETREEDEGRGLTPSVRKAILAYDKNGTPIISPPLAWEAHHGQSINPLAKPSMVEMAKSMAWVKEQIEVAKVGAA